MKLSERIEEFISGAWSERRPSKQTLQVWKEQAEEIEQLRKERRLQDRLIDANYAYIEKLHEERIDREALRGE